MPVVINELEAVVEPSAQPPAPPPENRAAPLTPTDVTAVLRHAEERHERVRAD